jgi:hypothetical protein
MGVLLRKAHVSQLKRHFPGKLIALGIDLVKEIIVEQSSRIVS